MHPIMKIGAAAAMLLLPLSAAAQDYPERPVSLVIPYPPGGNVDSAARIVAPELERLLGQPFVVENRAGANGMIAAEHVASAKPDGYTLFVAANSPLLFSPLTFGRPDAYDWKTDFAPIGPISLTPMVLTVRAELGIKTLSDLMERLDQDGLLMASGGAGSTNHLAAELLQDATGKTWRIVHYKGNAPSVASILSGETQFSFEQIAVILPHIRDGSLVPLAVTSSERLTSLPDVPTLAQTDIADFQAVTFTGLLAPDGTPEMVITKLSDALQRTLSEPNIIARFDGLGATATTMEPGEFAKFLAEIDNTWRPVVIDIYKEIKQ